jgi:hypothetical protein
LEEYIHGKAKAPPHYAYANLKALLNEILYFRFDLIFIILTISVILTGGARMFFIWNYLRDDDSKGVSRQVSQRVEDGCTSVDPSVCLSVCRSDHPSARPSMPQSDSLPTIDSRFFLKQLGDKYL